MVFLWETLGLSRESCYQKHHPSWFWDGTWGGTFSCKTGTCNGATWKWRTPRDARGDRSLWTRSGVTSSWRSLRHAETPEDANWMDCRCLYSIHNYIHVDCVLDMNIYHIWLEVSALFGFASFHGDYDGRNWQSFFREVNQSHQGDVKECYRIRVVRDLTGITNDIYKYGSFSVWWYKGAKPDYIMVFLRYSRAKTEKDTSSVGIIVSKFRIPGVWFWGPQVSEEPILLVIQWLGVHCFMFGSNFKKTTHFVRTLSHPLFQWVETCWNCQPPAPSRDTCEKHWNGLPRKRVMRRLTALVNGPLYEDRTELIELIW